jgi:hypothetical protein
MNRKLIKGIRITRVVALAMIAVPEPISTALGICVLGVLTIPSLLLRRQNTQQKLYLRHILTEYAHSYRPFGFGMGYKPTTSASLPYRFGEPLFNTQAKSTITPVPVKPTSISPPATTVFHVFDRELVSKRFANSDSRDGFEGYYGRNTNAEIKTPVYHTFDRTSTTRRYDNGGSRIGYVGYWGHQSFIEIKPVHHTAMQLVN